MKPRMAFIGLLLTLVLSVAPHLPNQSLAHTIQDEALPNVGAGVVLSGLNFAATAFHLAMALVMLLVTGSMWAGEAKGELP